MKNASGQQDSGVLSNPLSFLRSGYFYWGNAGLDGRGGGGYYWSLRSSSTTDSGRMFFYDTYLNPQSGYVRSDGYAVRCTDKSFTILINTSYSMKNNGETTENSRDAGLLSDPLSFLRNGLFYWSGAELGGRGGDSYYWSLQSYSIALSFNLSFSNAGLSPLGSGVRGNGFAVRCIQILHHPH